MVIPLKYLLSVSKMAGERKILLNRHLLGESCLINPDSDRNLT